MDSIPEDSLQEFANAYGRAFQSGDVEQIMAMTTDDFVALTPGVPPLVGQEAVRRQIAADLNSMTVIDLQFEHQDEVIQGEWGYAWGLSKGTVMVGDDKSEIDGKYLWVLKRQADGSWKLARDSAHGD